MGYFKHYDHIADMGIEGVGIDKGQAFEQAALALTALVTDPKTIMKKDSIAVELNAEDDTELLYIWLSRVVYQMAVSNMLFCDFKVKIQGSNLFGVMTGEIYSPQRHDAAVEIKAITYMDLEVKKLSDGQYSAKCVVDI